MSDVPHTAAFETTHARPASGAVPSPTLQQLLGTFLNRKAMLVELLRHILAATDASGSVYLAAPEQKHRSLADPVVPVVTAGELPPANGPLGTKSLEQTANLAARTRRIQITSVPQPNSLSLVCVPVVNGTEVAEILAAYIPADESQLGGMTALLELMAHQVTEWDLRRSELTLDWEARAAAASAELVSRIATSRDIDHACYLVVNELQDLFGATRSAVSLTRASRMALRLKAISGMSTFDASTELARRLRDALDECVVRDSLTIWPPIDAAQRHATRAHRQLAEHSGHQVVLSSPLRTVDGRLIGAYLFLGQRQQLQNRRTMGAIATMAPHLATAIASRRLAQPSRLQRTRRWLLGDDSSSERVWIRWAAIAALVLLPLAPVPHRVRCDCVLEPVLRRFSVAPYPGILHKTHVKPGDVVTAGQVLANMDDRQLRWELSALVAERSQASKSRDVAMAEHNVPEAQMATLETQRLDLKIKQLRHRQDHLEIASAVSGMVLSGDLEDAEGAPVETGEVLFEIGPLEPLKLELAIAESDLAYVESGMRVTAHLEGYQKTAASGTVDQIRPRSEIRDNQNVFIAEVVLPNTDGNLRPGMSGTARVRSGYRPLAWIWFHRAVHRLRVFLGV